MIYFGLAGRGEVDVVDTLTRGYRFIEKRYLEKRGAENRNNKKTYTVSMQYNNKQSFITIK
ncbi:hypothetical protein A4H97_08065 [Niastella yeongjuensis]|uniref:Uncharacterized protein n=1 Tax=Niastella yeongjuensis TaxID=354355 RepID=A0A1V9EMS1_9BACT|nr:hypothetical protein A4H97_08065 [Niastella yeongjuensis]